MLTKQDKLVGSKSYKRARCRVVIPPVSGLPQGIDVFIEVI